MAESSPAISVRPMPRPRASGAILTPATPASGIARPCHHCRRSKYLADPTIWPPSKAPSSRPSTTHACALAMSVSWWPDPIGPNARCRRSISGVRSSSASSGLIVVTGGAHAPRAAYGPCGLCLCAELVHDLVGDLVVGVDVLHLVRLFEHVDELEHLLGGLLIERHLNRRQERRFSRLIVDTGLLQRGPHRHEVGRLAHHLVGLADVVDLFGTRVEHGHQHVVLAQ